MTSNVQDQQQIAGVLTRYAIAIDSRDWDLFRTCFTPDVAADYGDIGVWNGVEEITAFMVEVHSGPSLHRLSTMAITLDGDRATARTYVDALVLMEDQKTGANSHGYYDDELVRTDAGWRIAKRSHTGVRLVWIND